MTEKESKTDIIPVDIETNDIKSFIHVIRGQQVMIDSDLAVLYGYEVRALNQQVKRNISRFPEDFMFQLTKEEVENLKSQFVTSSWGGSRKWALINRGGGSDERRFGVVERRIWGALGWPVGAGIRLVFEISLFFWGEFFALFFAGFG